MTPQQPNQFEQEIDLKELLFTLWHNRLVISTVTVVSLIVVFLLYLGSTPEYRSTSMVLIKSSKSSSAELMTPFESMTGTQLQNDIELIKSFPLAEEVVRGLYRQSGRDSLELFRERRYISPIAGFFGAGKDDDAKADEKRELSRLT